MSRNQFGTRLASRVNCEKCGKVDYVTVRVASSKQQFCRDCAEKILYTFDQGRIIAEKQTDCVCTKCQRHFLATLALTKKKEQLLCLDCLRGFDVWRGKASVLRKENNHSILTKIGSRTTFRKNIDDTN